jgi:hypothetical protein
MRTPLLQFLLHYDCFVFICDDYLWFSNTMYVLYVFYKLNLVVKENDMYHSKKVSSRCFECMFDVVIIVTLSVSWFL